MCIFLFTRSIDQLIHIFFFGGGDLYVKQSMTFTQHFIDLYYLYVDLDLITVHTYIDLRTRA